MKVFIAGNRQEVSGNWLNQAGAELGAPIPRQIADKLRGKKFASFDQFRQAFWQEVAKDNELSRQFNKANLRDISNGLSAYPPVTEQVGGRKKYEIHHVKPISQNGAIYDIDNLRVLTPKRHIEIHSKKGDK
ncbi:HNH endonuclease signature motif containing protein [Arsenophonus sp. aPb]|uniref:HNH endonuclease signature motif containing protein n=1 Tax=Arsenophonus sp. aPb TaxID=3041619 RepID=UPI0024699735|nr:HNH endonuclease signature motif containing protein [Arsenophonus sp. aPb]WGL99271.1 HNH endonuclease signature motif containing protein [Arsenophonus sp. aPb]